MGKKKKTNVKHLLSRQELVGAVFRDFSRQVKNCPVDIN